MAEQATRRTCPHPPQHAELLDCCLLLGGSGPSQVDCDSPRRSRSVGGPGTPACRAERQRDAVPYATLPPAPLRCASSTLRGGEPIAPQDLHCLQAIILGKERDEAASQKMRYRTAEVELALQGPERRIIAASQDCRSPTVQRDPRAMTCCEYGNSFAQPVRMGVAPQTVRVQVAELMPERRQC
jgi:hypothetical protein